MKEIIKYLQAHKNVGFLTIEKMLLKRGFKNTYYGQHHDIGVAHYDKGKYRFILEYTFGKNGNAGVITDWYWHDYAC